MTTEPTLLILADDLTGAADCAARWLITGQPATVQLVPRADLHSGATAFLSDSRHLLPAQAADRVQQLLSKLGASAGQRWYKKIDSTLRGNLGAELDATMAALGQTHALICPAFPAQQRGLTQGVLVCDRAIAGPISLPALLAEQSQRPVASIALDCVRDSPPALANQIRERASHASLIVCDAISEADLYAIVAAALLVLPEALLCGSAGLFGALAARYPPAQPAPVVDLLARRVLIVIGSGSPMAHRQLHTLQERYYTALMQAEFDTVDVPPAAITLLHLPPPPMHALLDGPYARGLAEQTAAMAGQWIEANQPDLLIVVGGDTAMALFDRLGITELLIQSELMPGIPLSHALASSGKQYQLILKAGNFGHPATLADLLDRCADLQSVRRI